MLVMYRFRFVAHSHKGHWLLDSPSKPRLRVDGEWTRRIPWDSEVEVLMSAETGVVRLRHHDRPFVYERDVEVWADALVEFRAKGARAGFLDVTVV